MQLRQFEPFYVESSIVVLIQYIQEFPFGHRQIFYRLSPFHRS